MAHFVVPFLLCLAAFSLLLVRADIYMHSPAGSNNRNRERRENRRNANRLFDSQNNDKGGYPWQGDREVSGAPDPMVYYEGSSLDLEWTVQHGCGADPTTDCQVTIQYACDDTLPDLRDGYPTGALTNAGDAGFDLRAFARNNNGNTTPGGEGTDAISEATKDDVEYGRHETFDYYEACENRQRNKGLFTADQNLNGNDATKTRQNPNGNRSGFECPEERDYYPYWAPAPWRDVAVLVSREEQCSYYQQESRNVKPVHHCVMTEAQRNDAEDSKTPISATACTDAGGSWEAAPAWNTAAPACRMHARSRQNHLGDVVEDGEALPRHARFTWTVPGDVLDATGQDAALCALRMRYNVSTTDYDALAGMSLRGSLATALPLSADDNCDQGDNNGCGDGAEDLAGGARPRYNRPYVQAMRPGDPELGIALNTNQAGRTFQDRSYVFRIQRRPSGVSDSVPIVNVNTRGKRGNIVQVFPAVEYDFTPQNLEVMTGSLLHIQWTGSDFNVARNPNNGEGWRYSDRSNLVEAAAGGHNFPLPENRQSFFGDYETKKKFALLGQQQRITCGTYEDGTNNEQNAADNCGKLNAAPAHFDGGLVEVGAAQAGQSFTFLSTRNNNFSNRGQKWTVSVSSKGSVAALVAGSVAGAVVTAGLAVWLYTSGTWAALGCCCRRKCSRANSNSSTVRGSGSRTTMLKNKAAKKSKKKKNKKKKKKGSQGSSTSSVVETTTNAYPSSGTNAAASMTAEIDAEMV